MNTTRFITGIFLLVIAALLAVLNFALPPDKLMFMVGDANLPLVPAIVLGAVAIWILSLALVVTSGLSLSAG